MNTDSANRVLSAVSELKDAVKGLIEDAHPSGVEGIFDGLYPGRSSLSVRGARMALFNAVVALLGADLRASGARKKLPEVRA